MTPAEFIARWHNNSLTERAGAQAHFDDLCELLGVANPRDPEHYCFEKGARKDGGGDGWADVIAGNPPFLGGSQKRGELGDAYLNDLNRVNQNRVPGGADLVCDWFEKAHVYIERGHAKAAGLVVTNSIRGGSNRKVLERIVNTIITESTTGGLNDDHNLRLTQTSVQTQDGGIPTGSSGSGDSRHHRSTGRTLDQAASGDDTGKGLGTDTYRPDSIEMDDRCAVGKRAVAGDESLLLSLFEAWPDEPWFDAALKKRTLTNLYNAKPGWLINAHRVLDLAVAHAYDWQDYQYDWTDETILQRLLALNLERSLQV